MEQIAKKVDFAVGTLYNYYKSKGNLLLSISNARSTLLDDEVNKILNNTKASAVTRIYSLLSLYLKNTLIFPKKLWREFIGYIFLKEPALLKSFQEFDTPFIQIISTLVLKLIEKNEISYKNDPDITAKLLYNLMRYNTLLYIIGSIETEEEWKSEMYKKIKMLINGLK